MIIRVFSDLADPAEVASLVGELRAEVSALGLYVHMPSHFEWIAGACSCSGTRRYVHTRFMVSLVRLCGARCPLSG